MPAGNALTPDQRRTIERARAQASAGSGLDFHVYIGPSNGAARPGTDAKDCGTEEQDSRAGAQRLHSALPAAERAVLLLIDPRARVLEIVTGGEARRVLDDSSCGLAALTMQTAFVAGDIAGGIARGLHQLGDHARRPDTLHRDQA